MAQDRNKLSQAQNAVETANNAVGQAEDHPSDKMVQQAEMSLLHAQAAVHQAQDESGSAEQLQDQLASDRSALSGTKNTK
ncbi:hypothetical protein [Gorillibacterium sp. sgz5001074]|uniref:hypothetical protein n=1 Tax=Gorillibacterium sp. sgz5001074 TaxID=3446695 RepID=UPI003F67E45B